MTLREYIRSKAFLLNDGSEYGETERFLEVTDIEALCLAVRRQALEEAARVLSEKAFAVDPDGPADVADLGDHDLLTEWMLERPGDCLLDIHDAVLAIPCTLDGPAPEVG